MVVIKVSSELEIGAIDSDGDTDFSGILFLNTNDLDCVSDILDGFLISKKVHYSD
jgi:hypothetical protein